MKSSIYTSAIAASLIGLASLSAHAATPSDLLGATVAPQSNARTIDLSSGKSYVNVSHGDVVNFRSGNGQVFAVQFNGVRQSFDLNSLAPAGALDRTIKVYVTPRGENDFS